MKKILFFTTLILTIAIAACKKENLTNSNNNSNDVRNKYVGNYNVTEFVKKPFLSSTYSETNTFVGKIEKYVDTDSLIYPESDSLLLYFNQAVRTQPWSNGIARDELIYKMIGTDSLIFIFQANIDNGGKIYGNNDSIVIHFWHGASTDFSIVTQKWIKI